MSFERNGMRVMVLYTHLLGYVCAYVLFSFVLPRARVHELWNSAELFVVQVMPCCIPAKAAPRNASNLSMFVYETSDHVWFVCWVYMSMSFCLKWSPAKRKLRMVYMTVSVAEARCTCCMSLGKCAVQLTQNHVEPHRGCCFLSLRVPSVAILAQASVAPDRALHIS